MRRFLTLIASYSVFAIASNASAQVVPDRTLPNNSVVSDELEITGGTTAGNNLFHSFVEFSVNAGETAFFNHDLAIENIIGRVTGNSVSAIDGLIRSLGEANLFLINPNGIIFGEGAALDVGGSFIGSTAESILFADGSEFSAVNSNSEALLTVSIPIGLQYGANTGDITVNGTGNNLSIDPETFTVNRSDRPVGLEVSGGNTLALIGGNVFLPGGNLTAAEGKVVIGSVDSSGLVKLTPDAMGWDFDYAEVAAFGEIELSEAASVEVSGDGGGIVRFQGREISLSDGSAILADTLGNSSGRVLELSATDSIELIGSAAERFFPTRLSTDVDLKATGEGGNLTLDTDSLLVAEGAQVNSNTFGLGNGGNLTVTASEIAIVGISTEGLPSGLFAQSDLGNTGDGGNLTITTDSLLVAEGAQVATSTFGSGDAGNLTVEASSIELISGAPEVGASGLFANAEAESSGDGGNINIQTNELFIAQGAQIVASTQSIGDAGAIDIESGQIELTEGAVIATSTLGSGNGGNLRVNASSIELIGSRLFADAAEGSSGEGGNLQLVTDRLLVTQGAQVFTNTFGSGNAGNLEVRASKVELLGGASGVGASGLFARAESLGDGGNINLTTNELVIADGAQITASTNGIGNAGTINVKSQQIDIIGTSPSGNPSGILANVIESEGAGGSIVISTDNISVTEGAQIATSTSGSGNSGNLTVFASDFVILDGTSETGASGLFANAVLNDGDGGDVTVNTDFLLLTDGATISVSNFPSADDSFLTPGEGAAGNVSITASDIVLDRQATITANTVSGNRGNLDLQTDLLLLRRGSQISTNAEESATGGDITINTSGGFIVAIPQENSDITANAVFGRGGNVNISTGEIFGIQARNSLTPLSDITASSEFGIDGSVVLNTQDLNPTEEATELPETFEPPQLDRGCQATDNSNSSFMNIGQGGLAPQPSDALSDNELIGDVRLPKQWVDSSDRGEIVEAQSWIVNQEGKVMLVADRAESSLLGCNVD